MTEEKAFYFGIDLGTTNSLIGWGLFNPKKNTIEPKIVEIPMKAEGGGTTKKQLLPSVVFFKDTDNLFVGEYAKKQYALQPQRVSKSVKSKMGTDYKLELEGKKHTPAEISSHILKMLKSGAKQTFGFDIEDVVITVPASFDTDMRKATLEAAEMAGFKVKNDDGSDRQLLLDEPRAVLYDFINRQNLEEIPSTLLSLKEPKNVLVFDLGGGTLDVSLHKVFYNQNKERIDFEDIAVSRYTNLGGDQFDEYVRDEFFRIFKAKFNKFAMPESIENQLKARLLELAEQAKIDLSSELSNRILMGLKLDQPVKTDILQPNIVDNKAFETTLTIEEYEQIVSPLLANELSIQSLYESEDVQSDFLNIIDPILDVLRKALERGMEPKVDAVLLNGGMTKLPLIHKRLKSFFGFDPIQIMDPDKSVARGAVVYHYYLHRGEKVSSILNETIGIGTSGRQVSHMIPAGTILPCQSTVRTFEVDKSGSSGLRIPIYLGRRTDTNPPNRQISDRVFDFNRPLDQGEEISIQISVDESNVIRLKGWFTKDPKQTFEDITYRNGGRPHTTPSAANREAGITASIGSKASTEKQAIPPGWQNINKSYTKELQRYLEEYKKTWNPENKSMWMKKIKAAENILMKARNADEVTQWLLGIYYQSYSFAKGRILRIIGYLAPYLSESVKENVFTLCCRECDALHFSIANPAMINDLILPAILFLSKSNHSNAIAQIEKMLRQPTFKELYGSLFIAYGKVAPSNRGLGFLAANLNRYNELTRIGHTVNFFWMLGKLGSRECAADAATVDTKPFLDLILSKLQQEKHVDALSKTLYALGELADQRNPSIPRLSPELKRKALGIVSGIEKKKFLDQYRNPAHQFQITRFASLARKMIEGTPLTLEEMAMLTESRAMPIQVS